MIFDYLIDAGRVLCALPWVEAARRQEGPASLLQRVRKSGMRCFRRSSVERYRLRQTICAIDSRMPGGGNCYRRALLEIALDPDAAEQTFSMGLCASGGPRSGHAWLGSNPANAHRRYDAIISL
jgi:hypothetical protein